MNQNLFIYLTLHPCYLTSRLYPGNIIVMNHFSTRSTCLILVISLLFDIRKYNVSATGQIPHNISGPKSNGSSSDMSFEEYLESLAASSTENPPSIPGPVSNSSPYTQYPQVHNSAFVASTTTRNAETDLLPGTSPRESDSISSPNSGSLTAGSFPSESRKRKIGKYFQAAKKASEEDKRMRLDLPDQESAKRVRNAFKPNFDQLLKSWTPERARTCQLPQKENFFCGYAETDYLALAIKYQDTAAMKYAKGFINFQEEEAGGGYDGSSLDVSTLLQRVLMDLIMIQDAQTIMDLGEIFPGIFTRVIAFDGTLKNLQNTSLIRIAFDQKKTTALTAMFFSVPPSYIEDFWSLSEESRGYFIEAIAEGVLPLTFKDNISERVRKEMFYTSVTLNNVAAVKQLEEWGLIDLKDTFVDPIDGMTFTAMYYAAYANYTGLFEHLGRKEPSLYFTPTSTGMLPAHVAALNGHIDILKLLSQVKGCFMTTVKDRGIDLTPFAMAWRNNKRAAAECILSQLMGQDSGDQILNRELLTLASWAIVEDSPDWLDFVLEGKHLLIDGRIPGSEFSLLEMVVRGSVDPADQNTKRCSIKCLETVSKMWKELGLPTETFSYTLGVRGSILGLVHPDDIDAFVILIENLGICPNDPIWAFTPNRYSPKDRKLAEINSHSTTFLIRQIELQSRYLLNVAVEKGADPRIVACTGLNASETALKVDNRHAIELLKQFEE